MKRAEIRVVRGMMTAILDANVQNAPTVVGSARRGTAGAKIPRGLRRHLPNHKVANGNCENLVFIRVSVIREAMKSVLYPYTSKSNGEVPTSLGDMFVCGYYV